MSESRFQPAKESIIWRLHFTSSPEKVFEALSTNEGRKRYWAESANEVDGKIHYVFLGGIEDKGDILAKEPHSHFAVTYFGWTVNFDLKPDNADGTDLTMTCKGVSESDRSEIIAGWVSWLMAMKAAVDFNVDLRNHDPERTWFTGYVDN